MDTGLWAYGGFTLFVLAMLALDLGVFHRKAHAVSIREALAWSGVWVGLALAFNLLVWRWKGPSAGLEFLAGYLIEKSLSVDNIFVFLLVFSAFRVPDALQHRVLFWGILGALAMRAAMIAAGAALLERFHWIIYVFGAFLVLSGIKMLLQKEHGPDPAQGRLVRGLKRLLPFTDGYRGDRFAVREAGRRMLTPLFLVLVVVEATDLVFAVDSIPAIFAVTSDPFIVYTSNVFAILGLRSLYFALAGIVRLFRYLKAGLSAVLCFVGLKMLLIDLYKVPVGASLGVIAGILAASILASVLIPKRRKEDVDAPRPAAAPPRAGAEC